MSNPYRSFPPSAFWRQAVAAPPPEAVDPVAAPRFQIAPTDRVVTAGSCFAQHIARHLRRAGFNYHVTETAHPFLPADLAAEYNFDVFSARYGDVCTTRQLIQLFRRSFGRFVPRTVSWQRPDGRFVDPFRPQITPDGYATEEEMLADRAHHLRCTRMAFEEADVFIFTLGLTEAWMARDDGAVLPLCPGVSGGVFDAARHAFVNLRVAEVVADLREFLNMLRFINPEVRVLLTVSPVPLAATASGQHVLTATTASKSILRAACEELLELDFVDYFPSYEIITGAFSRGRYYGPDLRSVTEAGVGHVMEIFMKHYTAATCSGQAGAPPPRAAGRSRNDAFNAIMHRMIARRSARQAMTRADAFEAAVGVVCEEEALAEEIDVPFGTALEVAS